MNTYSSPSLGQVSASSLDEAARLLAGRAATAKYGRNGRLVNCETMSENETSAQFDVVIGGMNSLCQITATRFEFTVEMVGKPTLK